MLQLLKIILIVYSTRSACCSASILLNCGSTTGAADEGGRQWVPDSSYLTGGDSISASAQYQDSSLPSPIPYMSARIFTAEGKYKFPIDSTQRHWLRLHFYPDTSFDPGDAFLTATISGITLLHNFSAFITAKALTLGYIIKEFSLYPSPSNGYLTLNLKPQPGSYAFVNGIEVIPMPELFQEAATMVGFTDSILKPGDYSLETMFRLNVGGSYISPVNDSHLTRTWYDDSPYVYGAGRGVSSRAPSRVKLKYEGSAEYVAPADVYRTVRTMGDEPEVNRNYNLTWVLTIDANFTYLLRLHFCEYRLSKVNQRVFDIFVNNRSAALQADVILWSGGTGIPVHKDYTMYVGGEELWVALHPSAGSGSEYEDALLNGMEVFKLNDTSGNLAGPNPMPSQLLLVKEEEEEERRFVGKEKKSKAPLIGGAIGGVASLVVAAALLIVFRSRQKRGFNGGYESHASSWLPVYRNSKSNRSKSTISGRSTVCSNISSEAACNCRYFTLQEIKRATKNFSESEVIGVGGFGKVYKGVIDGSTEVAIKRSNPWSEQGVNEFQTEIEMLSKLRHKHLVSLIGYSEEGEEMILVYDYMEHGTLREHLQKNKLPWKQRLEMCIGVAKGLHHLHTGAKYTIIHRDVKTTNILLDHQWVAKVSDFGLSKTGPDQLGQGHVSTMVKGSFGYLDPEYFKRQQLTEKSDVYSFGVVLFEVLSGRAVLNPALPKEEVNLADWAVRCVGRGRVEDVVDSRIRGSIGEECLAKFVDTASKCLLEHGMHRPSMGDVLWKLEFALQLHEEEEGSKYGVQEEHQQHQHFKEELRQHFAKEEDDGDIFSQIVNPKGR